MTRANYIKRLIALGYKVTRSDACLGPAECPGIDCEHERTLHIEGCGIKTYVREDDHEALDALADEWTHVERVTQMAETAEETMRRDSR